MNIQRGQDQKGKEEHASSFPLEGAVRGTDWHAARQGIK